ncbi:hypothetical protein EJ04DRAFT_471424, partial [Polyplosphaeria fusca]
MPPYDSDSSDEGDGYTETNTLLGYASKEPTGDTISHLGGTPTWLDVKTPPTGALAKCRVCNDLLTLLLELNGDLPDHFPGHERRLYILSCRRKTCRRKEGSIRGIRGVRVAKTAGTKANTKKVEAKRVKPEPTVQPKIGGSLFGVKDENASQTVNPFSNPFSSSPARKASTNPFSPSTSAKHSTATQSAPHPKSQEDDANTTLPETFASKARLSSPVSSAQSPRPCEPWPDQSAFAPPYPHLHLDAEYETLDVPSAPEVPENARMDIDADASGSGGKEDKEVFESSLDKTFQKFADRIGQNAEQVLRYEFKGKPLLYSDNDAVGKLLAPNSENGSALNAKITMAASRQGTGMPRCQICGADRVFELQLTPHAITELEAEELGIEGMEWGAIIFGVCDRDCKPNDVSDGEVGYAEEWVGVQWEELAGKKS